MTEEDIDAASEALVRWLKSQYLSPDEAVPVLAKVIAIGIASLADSKSEAYDGAKLVDGMVRGMISRWSGRHDQD